MDLQILILITLVITLILAAAIIFTVLNLKKQMQRHQDLLDRIIHHHERQNQ